MSNITASDIHMKSDDLQALAGSQPHTDVDALQAAQNLPEQQKPDGPDMLDFLMQHVEAESGAQPEAPTAAVDQVQNVSIDHGSTGKPSDQEDIDMQVEQEAVEQAPEDKDGIKQIPVTSSTIEQNAEASSSWPPPGLEAASEEALEQLKQAAATNNLPPTADTLVQDHIPPATETAKTEVDGEGVSNLQPGPEREWETDSSFDSSDSSDTSSDSDDDSDEDEADEYRLLDPYEQARILMAEDGGGGGGDSDEEGSKPAKGGGGAGLRSINEKVEDILPKPDIIADENTPIQELGNVEAVVENTVLIKAKVSGEHRVLETGSAVCLAPPIRTIVGAVAETLGRVEQPLYTVNFASVADMRMTFGLTDEQKTEDVKGTKIFYVEGHSTFVFTQPLKAAKGTDASNIHDEEVGEDEMEFSDDEAEAEYKRQRKLQRKGIDPSSIQPGGRGGRGGRAQRGGRGRGGYSVNTVSEPSTSNTYSYLDSNVEMNYDEVKEGEANHEYTPLRRPDVFTNGQMSPPSQVSPQSQSNRGNFNQNRNRGGRGNDRGRGQGTSQNHNQQRTNQYSPSSSSSMYSAQQQYYPNPMQQQAYFGFQPQPNAPYIMPSSGPYAQGGTVPPSPITPLPGAYGGDMQNQWAQYHANQAQQYANQQAQFGNQTVNAEAIAQVQRQLEELRRQGMGGGN